MCQQSYQINLYHQIQITLAIFKKMLIKEKNCILQLLGQTFIRSWNKILMALWHFWKKIRSFLTDLTKGNPLLFIFRVFHPDAVFSMLVWYVLDVFVFFVCNTHVYVWLWAFLFLCVFLCYCMKKNVLCVLCHCVFVFSEKTECRYVFLGCIFVFSVLFCLKNVVCQFFHCVFVFSSKKALRYVFFGTIFLFSVLFCLEIFCVCFVNVFSCSQFKKEVGYISFGLVFVFPVLFD